MSLNVKLPSPIFRSGNLCSTVIHTKPSATNRVSRSVISCRCPEPSATLHQLSVTSFALCSSSASQNANPPYMPGTLNQNFALPNSRTLSSSGTRKACSVTSSLVLPGLLRETEFGSRPERRDVLVAQRRVQESSGGANAIGYARCLPGDSLARLEEFGRRQGV